MNANKILGFRVIVSIVNSLSKWFYMRHYHLANFDYKLKLSTPSELITIFMF